MNTPMYRTGTPGSKDYLLEVYMGRGRLAGLAVLGLLFVLGGVWMVSRAATEQDTSAAVGIVGGVCTLFFGTCLVFCLLRLTQRTPALVIDADGIHDHASGIPAGTIPWNNVAIAHVMRYGMQQMLSVSCHDPQTVIHAASGPRRLLLSTNLKLLASPVNIPGILLPANLSTIKSDINAVLAARRKQYDRAGGGEQQP